MTDRKITINKEIIANPKRFVSQVSNPGLQLQDNNALQSKPKFVTKRKPTTQSDIVEQFPSSSAEPSETPLTQEEYLSNLLPKVNKKQKREEEIVKTPTKKRSPVPVYSPSWSQFTPESVKQEFQNKQLENLKPVALFQEEEITELPDFEDVETGGKKRNKKSNKNKRRIVKNTKKMRKMRKTRKSKKSRKIRK